MPDQATVGRNTSAMFSVTDNTGTLTPTRLRNLHHWYTRLTIGFPLPESRDLHVTVEYPDHPSFLPEHYDPHTGQLVMWTGGATESGTANIHLNIRDWSTPKGFDKEGMMPAGRHVPTWKYTATHEYDHARLMNVDKGKLFRSYTEALFLPGMSEYGMSSPLEARAEAFAEWVCSTGHTHDEIAIKYAHTFGWDRVVLS